MRAITLTAVTAGTAYDLDTAIFFYSVDFFPEVDIVILIEYEVVDAAQSLSSKEYVEVSVQGAPVKEGLPLESILDIAAAIFAAFTVAGYLRVQHFKERKKDLMKLETMRKENIELHENLKMLQKYSQAEVDMIEAQITTFRGDFKKMKTTDKGGAGSTVAAKDIEKLLIVANELESHGVI